MEVADQDDSLGNVSETSLQQPQESSSCRSLARDGLNVITKHCTDQNEAKIKTKTLFNYLQSDVKAVDIKWSLFVASALNYRFDSCLKPFPPLYVDGLEKNIDKLREVIGMMPPMLQLQHMLRDSNPISTDVIDLLFWNLIEQDPKLITVNKEEYESALQLAPSNMTVQKPSFIFRVVHKWSEIMEERWETMVAQYGTLHAYHGSKLENFHSILRHGLQQHLNKNGLFGSGIYLSSELGVSLPYSWTGCGWNKSGLGSQLSCVALCEAINHPDVKCQQPGATREQSRSRALSRDSMGGEVPEKYFLVCNSDLVRVRYLLVYSKPPLSHPDPCCAVPSNASRAMAWLRCHKMVVLISAYIMLLLAIGLHSNPSAQRSLRRILRQLGL